ncbi:MAG: hypothetical protein HC822_06055 [Oscillochloris sp.]|nr:hypothetical protein [Oscillochloris sp.]
MRAFRSLLLLVALIVLTVAGPARATTRISDPLPTFGDVDSFAITPDGSRVIYTADTAISGRFALFSVPIDGSAAPRISADLTLTMRDADRSLLWLPLTQR